MTLGVLTVVLLGCASAPRQEGTGHVQLSMPRIRALPNFSEVRAGYLYRGAQPLADPDTHADGYEVLISEYHIRTVVDLLNEPVDHWIKRRRADCARMTATEKGSLRYVRLAAYEPFPSRKTLIRFLRIVADPANRPVFLHCASGENRTGAMIAGFRVVEDLWEPADAKAEMTNFGVRKIWQGANNRFIDERASDREAIRRAVEAPGSDGPAIVSCK
jgi:protein tyrosine/serine phosphatase